MVWLVIISWSPAYPLSSHASGACQVDLSPPDFMLVLLLVLLDPDEVLPPQILRHVACCVRVMGQCLRHLVANHREDQDCDHGEVDDDA